MVLLGPAVFISEEKFKNIRSQDIGKMTCDLLTILFSPSELAGASLSGRKSKMPVDQQPKKQLDIKRITVIKGNI